MIIKLKEFVETGTTRHIQEVYLNTDDISCIRPSSRDNTATKKELKLESQAVISEIYLRGNRIITAITAPGFFDDILKKQVLVG